MKRSLFILILVVLVSGLTSYGVVKLTSPKFSDYSSTEINPTIQKVNLSDKLYPDFTFAAETAVKSVVHVKVLQKGREQNFSIYDFFYGYGYQEQPPRNQMSSGSGVIITSDGYIVTNNHVVEGADDISVVLEDNNTYKARLVGSDAVTDIAVLKIDANNLPFLKFGDSDSLRLGEWVIAIGNPYNLRSTITAGIVSAKARSMPSMSGDFKIESFIQTDAAVNPGNSGGALVNTRGELVGINTAIASKTGAFTGYAFAVPSSITKKIVGDFIDFGTVKRALLGISMREIDGDMAKEKNLKVTSGVYIESVAIGSAAEKAGIKESDILVSINNIAVNSMPAVQEQITKYRPNDKITVGIIRDGKQKQLSVVLDGRGGTFAQNGEKNSILFPYFGATLRNATSDKLKNLRVRSGVEVVSVNEGKFKSAGIKEGFIITHINQLPITDIQEIEKVVKNSRRSLLIEGIYPDGTVVYYGMGL